MSVFEVDGLRYNYVDAGHGESVVLLHGFTGSAEAWNPLSRVLAQRFRVITIDLPGHGLTSSPAARERYLIDRVAGELAQMVERLGSSPAGWLGYSMGGRIALYLAVCYPQSVSALVLESASPGIASELDRRKRRADDETLASRIERDGVQSFVDKWERMAIFESHDHLPESVRALLRTQRLANRSVGLANSLRGMGTGAQPSLWDRLGNLTMPVQLITGELDRKFAAIGREMASAIPHAKLQVVPGAGHTVHLERPDEFCEIVHGFLSDNLRDRSDQHAGTKQDSE
jgi:2-succinyl-6-hydroxy-2,4-cyclohexadiene-1-carboxylate synthase